MAIARKSKSKTEFGDFQTPPELAAQTCKLLRKLRIDPSSVVEPTCGVGAFLFAALDAFPKAKQFLGTEINPAYVDEARRNLSSHENYKRVSLRQGDFFSTDWEDIFSKMPEPILVIGNPPWVTNSELGMLNSANLPQKSNFQNLSGFDAKTGKSNFDISEWMLIAVMRALNHRRGTMAMLCKTTVARKLLTYAWKNDLDLKYSHMYHINALKNFKANVDACLIVYKFEDGCSNRDCLQYDSLTARKAHHTFGYRNDSLVADIELYERYKHLQSHGKDHFKWRSGVKHDCSKVMEFRLEDGTLFNGHGESIDLESEYLFPMLKSSHLANGAVDAPQRFMLVTQKTVGDDTFVIKIKAPNTWKYLQKYSDSLDRRGSVIYKKRPRFSVFGIGDYSFAPYKVAISGFYKSLNFRIVGSVEEKPIVLDDTTYSLPCSSIKEATLLAELLNSEAAQGFFSAFIFWDAKRPITVDVLRRLDLFALARELKREKELRAYLAETEESTTVGTPEQFPLFVENV